MSRAAVRQLAILGVLCLVGLAAFIAGLGWLSSLTATGAAALPAIDAATRTITTSIRNEPPNLDSMRATRCDEHHGVRAHHRRAAALRRARQSRARRRRALGDRHVERDVLAARGRAVERRQTRHGARLRIRVAHGRRPGHGVAVRVHPLSREERRGDQQGRVAADRARRTRRRAIACSRSSSRIRSRTSTSSSRAHTYLPGARGFLQEPRGPLRGRCRGLALQRPVRARELGARGEPAVREEPDVLESRCDQARRRRHRLHDARCRTRA